MFAIFTLAYGMWWYNRDYIPAQPIAYSHRVHIQKAGLQCTNCHAFGDEGLTNPGMPPVSYCMECHVNVLPNSPEVQKLKEYYDNNEPVPWVKVNRLRNVFGDKQAMIYFPHKRHLKAGITCQECHGQIEAMDEVYQTAPMRMGWCISCHMQEDTSPNKILTDCWTCHK
jgi:hypothetical protein